VGERGECASTKTVKLVLKEHDFLFLLLDDIEHAALVRDSHDLLARVTG